MEKTVGAILTDGLRLRRNPSFYTRLCVLRARQRTQNTQTCTTTWVAEGDHALSLLQGWGGEHM